MVKVMTQLDLLTKHEMGSTLNTANGIASKSTKVYEDDTADELDE